MTLPVDCCHLPPGAMRQCHLRAVAVLLLHPEAAPSSCKNKTDGGAMTFIYVSTAVIINPKSEMTFLS